MCKNPCYKCQDRWVKEDDTGKTRTCHGTCERYAAFQVYNEAKKKANMDLGDMNAYVRSSAEKVKRKTGWYSNKDRR